MTKVEIPVSEEKIGYKDKVLLLGSCFADNIGAKFESHYFQAIVNPFGTLYNPASILKAITLSYKHDNKHYLLHHNGLWHSMMHHGSFSHPDKSVLLNRYEESQRIMREALHEASTIVVTFGTSWIYTMEGMIVANCHKMPANRFQRECMTAGRIIEMWLPLLVQIPNKHWIFTVSPIRHIKDGLHENQISKAILLQAIDCLASNSSAVSYFPSYEIMLDELRDYRFYAEDMVHPSQVAVEYIWGRFVDVYMTVDTQNEMRTLHQFWRDRHHRFLHPDTEEAIAFAQRTENRLQSLKKQYPWLE